MKKILIFIVVLALICGAYVLINKSKFISKPLNTFTHSSGGFSFKYPQTLVAEEKDSIAYIYNSNENSKPLASISVMYYPKYVSNIISAASKRSNVKIKTDMLGSFKTYEISSNTESSQMSPQSIIVSLEENDDPAFFLIATIAPNTIGFSKEQFYSIFKSLSVNKEAIVKLQQSTIDNVREKGIEAKLKATLSSIRSSAELYFDYTKSYNNLCRHSGKSLSEKLLTAGFKVMTDEVGVDNLKCLASGNSYAISIIMKQSNIWCVDSTGFIGSTSNMISKYSCK